MKLTTQRMLGWQTSCLRAFVVIFSFALATTVGSAQENKLVDEAAKPAEARDSFASFEENEPEGRRPVVAVGLHPATLLIKQVVELFGPRGMTVTAFEEGKTLKIEATNKEVVEDFSKLMELVAQQFRKKAEPGPKPTVEKVNALGVEPAMPLVKSLVELFEFRGAKVLEFEAGKRLKVEVSDDVLSDLEQMLRVIADETRKQVDLKVPDISGRWRYPKLNVPGGALDVALHIRRTKVDPPVFSAQRVPAFPETVPEILLKWRPDLQKFEVVLFDPTEPDEAELKLKTLQLSADRQSLRQAVALTEKGREDLRRKGLSEQKIAERYNPDGIVLTRVDAIDPVLIDPIEPEPSSSTPTPAKPEADSKMPDISGTWEPYARNEVIIRRAKSGDADFEMTTRLLPQFKKIDPYAEDTPPRRIKWFPEAQHFQTLDARNRDIASLTMKPNADGKSMHVTVTINGKPVDERFGKDAGEMEWQRTEANPPVGVSAKSVESGADPENPLPTKPVAPTNKSAKAAVSEEDHIKVFTLANYAAVEYAKLLKDLYPDVKITPDARTNSIIAASPDEQRLMVIEAILLRLDQVPSASKISKTETDKSSSPASVPTSTGIPNTLAAKQLVEQLGTQESAAAAEAATIRQLQANGQAEQNRQAIAEHQRKLKNLLSTAFDLKLQLEELQVKELQSRLSRLDRQIGQRKELREKIINRRAGELIEGDVLKWDAHEVAASTTPRKPVEDINHSNTDSSPAAVKQRRERVALLAKELPNGKVKPSDVLRALEELSQVAQFEQLEWRLHDLMEFAEQSRGPGVISSAEYLEIVAAHQKSRGRTSLVTSGEPQDKREKVGNIVIDLYAGSQVLPGLGRNPRYNKLVQTLNALKGVTVNFREAGKGDVIVMAIVRDPSQRCQREARQTQKESELRIAINAALKAVGIEAVRWDENAATENADDQPTDKAETPTGASKIDSLPSPEKLREQLEPFAKRVTAATESVRKLEVTYLRERSNSAELKRALDELTQARGEWRNRLKALELTFLPIGINQRNAEIFSDSLRNRVDTVTMQFADGKATEAELIAATESWKRATESLAAAKATMGRYDAVFATFADVPGHEDVNLAISEPVQAARSQPGYHPDVALAWLEAATSLKLEFVRFDDLHFWFKAALRVRESGAKYKSGDLIVTLNGQLFESLDQAVDALRPRLQADTSDLNDVVLPGGLAGLRQRDHFSPQNWCRYLEPGSAVSASIKLEVRVRRDGTEEPETCYISGVCISPEGLVVIPVTSRSLVPGEAVVAFGSIRGTARVVAADDEHGLTLIKLSSPNQPMFQWIKCREGQPSLRQRLQLHDGSDGENFTTHSTSVLDVNQPLPKPFLGNDAFVVNTHKNVIAAVGAPLMTVENELQGIVMASTAYAADAGHERQDQKRHIAIPAVHLAKLLDGHRKATARDHVERPDVKLSFADEESPTTAAPKSLDDWLAVLRARGNGDEVVKAAREIARLATTADAERAASALLAAAEYFDATSQTDANDHALNLAMRKLDVSGKTPAIVHALRDGPPRVRLFAFNCFDSLKDLTTAKDFPALVEQVLKIAAGDELLPRLISLRLLGETLPITRLDSKEFSTEERRELARRLVEFVPRDRVLQLLVTTMSDKQIDAALAAALQLAKQPEDAIDAQTLNKCLDVLASVTKGKLSEATASRGQRELAFDGLDSLGRRAAPVIPALIELLKSDDPDLKVNNSWVLPAPSARFERPKFTRSQIIQVIRNMGSAAKNSLPELEAAVPILQKKEQEDALLSPNSPKTSPPHSDQLRNAIDHIKSVGNPNRS